MIHRIKTKTSHFKNIKSGDKKHEIRDNTDRGFQKGDTVIFIEIDFDDRLTGNEIMAKITYVTNFNQPANQVVFSFSLI